jgi:hypothetical protein
LISINKEVDKDKLTNYADCTNKSKLWGNLYIYILEFKNHEYVSNMCNTYYGQNRHNECIQKENFCKMCCEWHVGASFKNKREDCNDECGNYLVGLPWIKKSKK